MDKRFDPDYLKTPEQFCATLNEITLEYQEKIREIFKELDETWGNTWTWDTLKKKYEVLKAKYLGKE